MASSDSNGDEFPWPSKKDRFFVPDVPKAAAEPQDLTGFEGLLADLQPDLGQTYREGYYLAGAQLARGLREDRDNWPLIYPMVYCFRHFVELSLKAVIEVYAGLLEEQPKIEVAKEHGVTRLWNEAVMLMDKAAPNTGTSDETDRNVTRCLNELNQTDKDSQLFRYPTDKGGVSVNDRLPRIDLDQFLKTMENLKSLFEGCEMQADYLIECRDDMREYYRP